MGQVQVSGPENSAATRGALGGQTLYDPVWMFTKLERMFGTLMEAVLGPLIRRCRLDSKRRIQSVQLGKRSLGICKVRGEGT